jgi:hypothetical protein
MASVGEEIIKGILDYRKSAVEWMHLQAHFGGITATVNARQYGQAACQIDADP